MQEILSLLHRGDVVDSPALSDNDRNIIPTDHSKRFGLSKDWQLNLNALTYSAACSKETGFLHPSRMWVWEGNGSHVQGLEAKRVKCGRR